MACSRATSVPRWASSSRRGALPGRNPGIRTSRASFRKAASMAVSNSPAGTLTRRRTLLPSSASTVVSMRSGSVTAGSRNPGEASAGRAAHRKRVEPSDGQARVADGFAGRLDRLEPLHESPEHELALHPGQPSPEAEVEAPGEGQVEVVGAAEVEAVGIGEAGRVPVRPGQEGQDDVALPEEMPVDLEVLQRVAVDELHRGVEAEDLFHRGGG